jgi:hypothetical protein
LPLLSSDSPATGRTRRAAAQRAARGSLPVPHIPNQRFPTRGTLAIKATGDLMQAEAAIVQANATARVSSAKLLEVVGLW